MICRYNKKRSYIMIQTRYIRDARGVCMGWLEYHDNGDVVARDNRGVYLGKYSALENKTRDEIGRFVCDGNMASSFIRLV